jgi:hypothetical protein
LSPLVTSLKPPIIIRRGPRGFGFTVHTIRVYYGDTDFYTMHHLVMVSTFLLDDKTAEHVHALNILRGKKNVRIYTILNEKIHNHCRYL